MLLYVTRSGNMSFKSHFGKGLLGKWSGDEYFFYLFYFNTIEWCVPKMHKFAFLNFKCHFLKMKQFQTSYFSEFVDSYFRS